MKARTKARAKASMKIESVKVGFRRYRVVVVDASELADNRRQAEISLRTGGIRLADNLPRDNMAESIVHEVLHALFHDIGLDWDEREEERMVERLSPRLAAFLVDNPKEVRELLKMLGA